MRNTFKTSLLIAVISVFSLPVHVVAGSATLNWRLNPESDLQGYRIYYGTRSRSYGTPISVGRVTTYTVNGLQEGLTYYFALTALDRSGNESGYSAEASKLIEANLATKNYRFLLDYDGNGLWDSGAQDRIITFGTDGGVPVIGDWNRDGTSDFGVFRAGIWYLDSNGDGKWESGVDLSVAFGTPADIPVPGDWNGDGRTDRGVFRDGKWYLDANGNGIWEPGIDAVVTFGIASDIPVCGDWDGDGKTDIGLFRNGIWYLDVDGNRSWDLSIDKKIMFGLATDTPVCGDWDGDGKTDIGVFRKAGWYLDADGDGLWDRAKDSVIQFGLPTDIPITGDWNGNGRAEIGLYGAR